MLKKLAKYGNSTTLVIDKAILELLNMDESSIVRLQTDGKSLIITPIASKINHKISYETAEALAAAKQSMDKKLADLKTVVLDKETMAKIQQETKEVVQKYAQAYTRFNTNIVPTKEFQDAFENLIATIDPANQSETFLTAFHNLKIQFCPELETLFKEIEAIHKKYNL